VTSTTRRRERPASPAATAAVTARRPPRSARADHGVNRQARRQRSRPTAR
jgi:hypothetical protein